MSLQTYRLFQRSRSQIWVRFNSSGSFKSILGAPKVSSPFEDPTRTRTPSIIAVNHGVFVQPRSFTAESPKTKGETLSDVVEQFKESKKAKQEVVVEAKKSEPEPEPRMSAIEELTSLKESLGKLEKATIGRPASGSGSGSGGGSGSTGGDDHGTNAEAEKRRLRMERNTRIGGMVLTAGSVIGLISFCVYYGRAKRDEHGNVITDEFEGSLLAPFYRIAKNFKLWRDYVVEPAREQLLPDPLPAPYLQPKYTIVIEMKNVLVSPDWTYKTGYRFAKRPALDYFLDVVGYPNFEVVIYTSESMMTAAPVVDSFDPKQRIMYKLFRDCTKYTNGHHVKDLGKLNRDLSKVIFIDFDAKSAQLHPQNMLRIPEWRGNMDDTSLVDLAELLKTIHIMDPDDVRPILEYYNQYDDPAKEFRRRAIYLAEQEELKKKEVSQQDNSLMSRYTGRLFGFRRHASA
ncbi:unnamed protein product [Caenorhabditis auriculariae]|uniref:Mitochondrial import inner membrane translocase subunit TIM50 n=1 Tax=Caenorhabditis auriculariae TaxID=2777116 RepID=A0A8S1HSX4_9PELO|nr:unnamed protein product [Caenorhabditis auriculariae]